MSSSQQPCVFCKIIAREVPANIIQETQTILVIQDIRPKAPIHYLIIPKEHLQDVTKLANADGQSASDIFAMTSLLSQKLSGDRSFRLVSNTGVSAGQSVFHVHFHFLAGSVMNDF